MGVNDNAWESLFEKYHIVEEISRNGAFGISASQIKEFREPRLMTKFDHKVVPSLMPPRIIKKQAAITTKVEPIAKG